MCFYNIHTTLNQAASMTMNESEGPPPAPPSPVFIHLSTAVVCSFNRATIRQATILASYTLGFFFLASSNHWNFGRYTRTTVRTALRNRKSVVTSRPTLTFDRSGGLSLVPSQSSTRSLSSRRIRPTMRRLRGRATAAETLRFRDHSWLHFGINHSDATPVSPPTRLSSDRRHTSFWLLHHGLWRVLRHKLLP